MYVRYHYDEETTALIEKFQAALDEYSILLREKLKLTFDDKRVFAKFYAEDSGRSSLIAEIAKIKSMSIPVRIEIVGV